VGYLGSLLLGWCLGANDGANIFAPAVGARMVSFRAATCLAASLVVVGAVAEGGAGVRTLAQITPQTPDTAAAVLFGAALTVMVMIRLGIPTSITQAVGGGIISIGLVGHGAGLTGLGRIAICWVTNPIAGALMVVFMDRLLRGLFHRIRPSVFGADPWLRAGLVLFSCYGAYALGANNVANVTAVLVASNQLSIPGATLLGGAGIALGALCASRRTSKTVGAGLVRLDAFTACTVVLAQAATVHFYAMLGVPVSGTQAMVGAVLGIGLIQGGQVIHWRKTVAVFGGWMIAPVVAGLITALFVFLSHFSYNL